MALTAAAPEIYLKNIMPLPQLQPNFTAISNAADFEDKTEVKVGPIWQRLNATVLLSDYMHVYIFVFGGCHSFIVFWVILFLINVCFVLLDRLSHFLIFNACSF